MNLGFALLVTFCGIFIVFLSLVALILLITLFGKVTVALDNRAVRPKKAKEGEAIETEELASAFQAPLAAPASLQNNDVIAAITAAVYILGEKKGKTYAVRSVRPAVSGQNPWAAAGLRNNVRPF